jgi:hypothetical protein
MTSRSLAFVTALCLAGASCTSPAQEPASDGDGGSSGSGKGGSTGAGKGGSPGTGGRGAGGSTGQGGSGLGSGGSAGQGGAVSGSGGQTAGQGGAGAGPGSGGAPGAGGASGAVDAAVDAPPASGSGTCMGVTAKFCDDWETQEVGKPPTGEFTISGTGVTVDSAQKFSGTKSLHYKTPGAKVMLTFTKQLPIADLHGRLMVHMPKKPTTQAHWDMIQSRSGNYHWELGGMYGNFELVVDPPDNGIDSPTPFPSGEGWHCIQWNFKSGTNVFSAKLDGELVKPSPVMNRWRTAGPFTNVTIGWEIFGSGAAEFWIDDLAFGEQEIPCPAK